MSVTQVHLVETIRFAQILKVHIFVVVVLDTSMMNMGPVLVL